jgi:hypothetical protein
MYSSVALLKYVAQRMPDLMAAFFPEIPRTRAPDALVSFHMKRLYDFND